MAKREQFGAAVKCPQCKKTGTATWEENENPVHAGGNERELIEVPSGFHRGSQNDEHGDPEILCDVCRPTIGEST